jgi:hypothetical protein
MFVDQDLTGAFGFGYAQEENNRTNDEANDS